MHSLGFIEPGPALQGTFPDFSDPPAGLLQRSNSFGVISDIPAQLFTPERLPGTGPPEQMTVMLMPEAAMHEDYRPVAWKNEVWFSRQVLCMQAIPQAGGMHGLTNLQLRLRVRAPDCRHVAAAGLRVVNVSQTSGSFPLLSISSPSGGIQQRLDMRQHNPGNFLEHGNGN